MLFRSEDHLEGLSGVNYCWREGTNFSLLRVADTWRVAIYPRADLSIEEQLTPESIEAALQHIVPRPLPYEVLSLRDGAVVQLDKMAGDPVDIVVNGRLIARGEVLVLNDNFCVRVAEIVTPDY